MKQWPHFERENKIVLDSDGFRSNVGIIICNPYGKLLWTKRIGQNAWQFPQGGIQPGRLCIGQKQKWFLLSLDSDENRIKLSRSAQPEFDDWRWVNYWEPVRRVVQFKREVYRRALTEFRGARDKYVNACAREKTEACSKNSAA